MSESRISPICSLRIGRINVCKTVLVALIGSHHGFVGADDLPVWQVKSGIIANAPDDKSVGAADDVNGEIIILEVIYYL